MSRLSPFNLTQIEIDNLPEKWQDWHLENSSISRTWSETLNEAVLDNQIKPELAHKLLHALMPATVKAWAEHTWGIPEVQMSSGPVVSYNRNDDMYRFVLEDVNLTVAPGEPNPMEDYQPPPRGRGKIISPSNSTADEGKGVTNTNVTLDTPHLSTSLPAPTIPTKRNHSTMTAITPPKSAKPKPLTITIPRLKIILYPSGFLKHHDTLPYENRFALLQAAKKFDREKMEELGLKKVVKRRVATLPRKKAKFVAMIGEKVERIDLYEDEMFEVTDTHVGHAKQEEQHVEHKNEVE